MAELLFYAGLFVSLAIGFLYFRDLGDVSQMILKVKRENTLRFIRHEYRYAAIGLGALAVMLLGHFLGGGPGWLMFMGLPFVTLIVVFLYLFPWVWVHLGLRNQQRTAQYFSIDEAKNWVNPTASVIVIENNGHARAHPDAQIMRPHLAGDEKGLGGEDIIMTYCAMANLGQGYAPSIEGQRLELEVLAQHGNNLIMRDEATGEPIQHIYGFRERDLDPDAEGNACPLKPQLAMKPWPTFRMTFRGFQKAYPEGEVFLNKPATNPLLRLLDMATEITFGWGIARQHQEAAPVMDNMSHSDDRLPNKTYVWGVTVGPEAACWTDDFVMNHGGLINVRVGGRDLVISIDQKYESLGIWYNDSGLPVTRCDFWGDSDQGRLSRVETLRAGLFWHVWVEFFPHTQVNTIVSTEEMVA